MKIKLCLINTTLINEKAVTLFFKEELNIGCHVKIEIINLTGNNLNSFIVDIIDCIFKEST